MGLRHPFKNSGRLKQCTLLLLLFSLLCYALIFYVTPNFQRSKSKIRAQLKPASLHSEPTNHTTYYTIEPPPDDPIQPSFLAVTAWNFTGSMDLDYPLNVDMPELVRRIMLNQTVDVEPINKPDFPILISNADRCAKLSRTWRAQPDLLILIKSAPENFLQRETIRLTWGSTNCWGGRHVVRLFLLGVAPNLDNQTVNRLSEEITYRKDIIQRDFVDHYHNNTHKLLFGIDWAVEYCPDAQMIMFVDDDFFVYPRNVVSFVESISFALKERLIAGYVWRNAIPVRQNIRGPKKKWAVSWDEFPDRLYPPYVAAGTFFLSMPLARELRIASWYTRYLRFDDVFLGILLKKLIRIPMHLPGIYAFNPVKIDCARDLANMLSSHDFKQPTSTMNLWDQLNCRNFCVDPGS